MENMFPFPLENATMKKEKKITVYVDYQNGNRCIGHGCKFSSVESYKVFFALLLSR